VSRSKFAPELCNSIVGLVATGLSIADSSRTVGVNHKTVKNWLARGRGEGEGPYREFAEAVDGARRTAKQRKPMSLDELRGVVSMTALNGSVAAQKLYWEMLRAYEEPDIPDEPEGDEEEDNPFSELDG
jgi:hypothetical protein